MVDLFDETKINKVPFEKKKFKEHAANKHESHFEKGSLPIQKKSIDVSPTRHHKRYGTKKPVEKFDKQDIISSWRDDI